MVLALVAAVLAVAPPSVEAVPGSLDPTYGTDGVALLPPAPGWTNVPYPVRAAATPAGAVWSLEAAYGATPWRWRLTRVAPGGGSAHSLPLDDFVAESASVGVVAVGEDAVVVTSGGGPGGNILRVRPDLTLASGFGGDGVVSSATNELGLPAPEGCTSLCGGYLLDAVAAGPSGSVLVAGLFFDGTGSYRQGLVRVLPGGTADRSFGVNGVSAGELDLVSGSMAPSQAITTDAAGRILVTSPRNLYRLTAAGVLDPSFSGDGAIALNEELAGWGCGNSPAARCEVVSNSDGSLLVAGSATVGSPAVPGVPGVAVVAADGSSVQFRELCLPAPTQVPGCGDISSAFAAATADGPMLHLLTTSGLVSLPLTLPDAGPLLPGGTVTTTRLFPLVAVDGGSGAAYLTGATVTPGTGAFTPAAGRVLLDVAPPPLSGTVSPPSGQVEAGDAVTVDTTCVGAFACQAVVVEGEVADPAPPGTPGQWDPPVTSAVIADGAALDTSTVGVRTVLLYGIPTFGAPPQLLARARYEVVEGGGGPGPTFPEPSLPDPEPPTPPACPTAKVVAAPQGITDLREGAYESDECIFVVAEQSGIVLDGTGVAVKAPVAGRNLANPAVAETTLRNRVVSSHLLHADRTTATGASTVSGTYVFDQPILGVVGTVAGLGGTDELVSLVGTQYNAGFPNRGVEIGGLQTVDDSVKVSGRTLTVTMQFSGQTDELRVFTGDLGFGGLEQTIDFPAVPSGRAVGSTVTLAATATSGLPVAYTAAGGCTVTGSRLTFTGTAPCTVSASQDGNATWAPAVPVERTATAARAAQTISFTLPGAAPAVGTPFTVAATATSRLPVSFTVSGPCTIGGDTGTTVTMTGAGSCVVTARQPGNDDYTAAPPVSRTTTAKGDQTITFPALPVEPAAGTSVVLAATATSGLPVTYVATGGCRMGSGNRLTFLRATGCQVAASQPGSSTWNPAPVVIRSTNAVRGDQTITFTMSTAPRRTGSTFTVTATASSGLPVTFTASGACSSSGLRGATIVVGSTGTCSVTASQAGNDDFRPAADVTRTVSTRADQTITFPALPADPVVGTSAALGATASSGLAVTYAAAGGCRVAAGRVTFTSVRECRVTAFQAGGGAWNPAPPVTRSTTATPADQSIVAFSLPTTPRRVGAVFTASARATSGLPVSFTASGACSSSGPRGSTITVTSAGTCSVTASQAGNASWNPAPDQIRTVAQPSPQMVTFPALPVGPPVGTTVTLGAEATSRLPITYVAAGGCTVAGNRLTFTRTQPCTVIAQQRGSSAWLFAESPPNTTTPTRGTQSITLTLPASGRDGWRFTVAASATSRLPVTLSASGACAVVGVAGTDLELRGAGSCVVGASQAGNENWLPADDVQRSMLVTSPDPAKADQSITFPDLPTDPPVGTAHVLGASATSNLAVRYDAAGGCRIEGPLVRFTGVEPCTVTASQPGNANWNAARPAIRTTTPVRGPQSINFNLPGPLPAPGSSFLVSATATSGLAVRFSASGACTAGGLDGSTITMVSAGTCTVVASQDGDANWLPATDVPRFAFRKRFQEVTFPALPVDPPVGSTHELGATATSQLPVRYDVGGACTLTGTTLRFTGFGDCTVTASQAGDATWDVAETVLRGTSAVKGTQSITFQLPLPLPSVGASFTVSATATSELPVTFDASGACRSSGIDGATITVEGPGTCTVVASQHGDADWWPAADVPRMAVVKADQSITFPDLPTSPRVGTRIPLGATATSSLVVTYQATGGCYVLAGTTGAELVFSGAEECRVAADQSGNLLWNPARTVIRSTTPLPGNQSITLTLPTPLPPVGERFTVTATATSGLTVEVEASGSCDNTDGSPVIEVTGPPGTCTIVARQPGNANWNAADEVTRTADVLGKLRIQWFATGAQPPDPVPNQIGQTKSGGLYPWLIDVASNQLVGGPSVPGGRQPRYTAEGACQLVSPGSPEVRLTAAGRCLLTAHWDGDARYGPAASATRYWDVQPAPQELSWNTTPPATASVGATFTVAATASTAFPALPGPGLTPVTFTTSDPAVCTAGGTNGATITIVGPGACVVTASQAGNASYLPATLQATTTVKATPTITIAAPAEAKLGSLITVTATTNGGGPVTLRAAGSCTADSGQYLIEALGVCMVVASVPGDASWTPRSQGVVIPVRVPTLTTLAGTPAALAEGPPVNGTGAAATFDGLSGIVVDAAGNALVTDLYAHAIRRVTPSGTVTTYAGRIRSSGSRDGDRTSARFGWPTTIELASDGSLWVGESCQVRRITPAGEVTTHVSEKLDADGFCDSRDGTRANAGVGSVTGIAAHPTTGTLYVVDRSWDFRTLADFCAARKITNNDVSTLAGAISGQGTCYSRFDSSGSRARLEYPMDIERDPRTGNFWIADYNSLRRMTPDGVVTTQMQGVSVASVAADGNGNVYLGSGGGIGFLSRQGRFSWLNSQRQFGDGPVTTAAGFNESATPEQDGYAWVDGLDVGPSGDLYLTNLNTVRRLTL